MGHSSSSDRDDPSESESAALALAYDAEAGEGRQARAPAAQPPPPPPPPSDFPSLPGGASMRSLLSDGLRVDLSLQPFQLARLSGAWEQQLQQAAGGAEDDDGDADGHGDGHGDGRVRALERPTLRCRNALRLHKDTLALQAEAAGPLRVASPEPMATMAMMTTTSDQRDPAQRAPAAAASQSPPAAVASVSRRYGVTFQLECLVPCAVQLHWLTNELGAAAAAGASSADSVFVPNPAAASVPAGASVAAGAAALGPAPAAPLVPPQLFAPGKHTFSLPAEFALDTTHLSDLQLSHSNQLRYYPLVIQISEQPPVGPGKEESKEGSVATAAAAAAAPSVSSSSSSSSSSSPSAPRVTSLTCYCTLLRASSGALSLRLLRQTVRILPSGDRFEVQEIYGTKGEGASGAEESNAECVVCLVEACDTAILPCRHHCLCHDCARIVQRQTPARCPVCRAHVDSTVRITNSNATNA